MTSYDARPIVTPFEAQRYGIYHARYDPRATTQVFDDGDLLLCSAMCRPETHMPIGICNITMSITICVFDVHILEIHFFKFIVVFRPTLSLLAELPPLCWSPDPNNVAAKIDCFCFY